MGLFSWLFPNDQDRIKQARKLLERQDPAGARAELAGVEGDEAAGLRSQANRDLVQMNLERALGEIESGEFDEANERLQLATELDDGQRAKELRNARKALREARKRAPKITARLGATRGGNAIMGGGGAIAQGTGGAIPDEAPSAGFGADPVYSLPADDPRVRYALLLETYPEALRTEALEHGEPFATAVLEVEDGKTGVEPKFKRFVSDSAIGRFERARAALASGNIEMAASDLQVFGDLHGHGRVGPIHTGVLLGQLLMTLGRGEDATSIVNDLRREGDTDLQLSVLHANLLEGAGDLPAADQLLMTTIRAAPSELSLYKMLARVRLAGGERLAAMQALESGIRTCCAPGGRCGTQPVDADAVLTLVRLYREDRLEPRRADELYAQVADQRKEPDWMDRYLDALKARNEGAGDIEAQAQALLREIGDSADPRRSWVETQFLQSA